MDILAKICADKKDHIKEQKKHISISGLQGKILSTAPIRPFREALQHKVSQHQTAIIAELKKASPSKGLIREDFDPATLAAAYEQGGATCLSVLTDVPYFQGDDAYIMAAKSATSLPILRKDFMLDPYQIVEARALGADCILLIMAALEDNQAHELFQAAREHGLDILVEIHNQEECERALTLGPDLLGVNNRNLKTLEIDLKTMIELLPSLPKDITLICESGIYTRDNIEYMQDNGIFAFLVGESLMRQDDVSAALQALIN